MQCLQSVYDRRRLLYHSHWKKKRLKLYTENGHKYVKNMYLKSPEQNTLKCK